MKKFLQGRELRIKVAKTKDENNTRPTTADEIVNPEALKNIEETAKRIVKNVALTVGAAVLAYKVVDTLSQIAVKKTRSGDNPED
ncbi:hypothetical protein SEA_LIBERTYBELL_31 [Streptomyces phage LibertyBell]|nr:hypothetical protein SEA_LIBERTYBELL_31 [Streptomyces phage LibertyBell]